MKTKSGVTRDWRNQNEYTVSIGGPIIKNKTFFFASWDHQFSAIRQNNVNSQVPTPCARKSIFRLSYQRFRRKHSDEPVWRWINVLILILPRRWMRMVRP